MRPEQDVVVRAALPRDQQHLDLTQLMRLVSYIRSATRKREAAVIAETTQTAVACRMPG